MGHSHVADGFSIFPNDNVLPVAAMAEMASQEETVALIAPMLVKSGMLASMGAAISSL